MCVVHLFSGTRKDDFETERNDDPAGARPRVRSAFVCSVGWFWVEHPVFFRFVLPLCVFSEKKRERDLERSDRAKNDTARWRCARRRVGVPREAS